MAKKRRSFLNTTCLNRASMSARTTRKEAEDVEMGGQEAATSPVTAKVVISQASLLKRASLIADSCMDHDDSNSLMKRGPLCLSLEGEKDVQLGSDRKEKPLAVDLKGVLPPGKPVKADVLLTKNPGATTRSRANSAPPILVAFDLIRRCQHKRSTYFHCQILHRRRICALRDKHKFLRLLTSRTTMRI